MEQMILQFVLGLGEKYPWALTIFAVVGFLRAVFKPIVGTMRLIADATPSQKDNILLDKAEASKVYKAIAWALDYVASIKLPGYDVKK